MKFIDLKPLSIKRLKAYRRSLEAKVGFYEICWCGSQGCDHAIEFNKNDPNYINLRTCLDRVNKELAAKQKVDKNIAMIPTVKEDNKLREIEKEKKDHWNSIVQGQKDYYSRREMRRQKRKEEPRKNVTVTFQYKSTGENSFKSGGKFIYDTPAIAKEEAERMKKMPEFSNVEVV